MSFKLNIQEIEITKLIALAAQRVHVDAFVIGGFVRDKLLGRPTKDIDVVCVGSGISLAEEVAQLIPKPCQVHSFKNFGTAMIQYQGMDIEFVGARKESYQRDSRKPIVEDGTLTDDQNRRDFTINALAYKLNIDGIVGKIIDPFNGISDLENGILRTPLNPDITYSDDPLRMMRAIRFATQLQFSIDPITLASISSQAERLPIVSQERITDEIQKIMSCSRPSIGWRLMFETGLLSFVFPELQEMHGIEIINGIGHKDNFFHTLKVLDNLAEKSDNIWLRWVAILHDIAKPITKKFMSGSWTFHGHEALGARFVPKFFRRMKLPMDAKMKYVQKLVGLHQRPVSLTMEEITDSAVRRLLFDAGDDIDDLLLFCSADSTSKHQWKLDLYAENLKKLALRIQEIENKDHLRNWQPPISGEVIMQTFQIGPCREVGIIKNKIKDAILDGIIANEYDQAFTYMVQIGKELGLQPRS